MKHTISLAVLLSLSAVASQAQITVTAGDLQNLSSYTTPGNESTFTPLVGGVSTGATFSDSSSLIGVAGGSNANGVDIRDWGTASEVAEGVQINLAAGAGLSQIVFKWYGSDVQISGFASDPMATGSDSAGGASLSDLAYSGGNLTFKLQGNWGGDATLALGDWSASSDTTLTIIPLDDGVSYTAYPRFSMTSVTVVPEPSTVAAVVGGLALLFVIRRRLTRRQ